MTLPNSKKTIFLECVGFMINKNVKTYNNIYFIFSVFREILLVVHSYGRN
jgi:hypothetical protein